MFYTASCTRQGHRKADLLHLGRDMQIFIAADVESFAHSSAPVLA
ncbi:hypothetical protein [uncultured Sphingomonas sp.]